MNILMSGGHGLIGTALTRELRGSGHRVVRLVRPPIDAGSAPDAVAWDPAGGHIDLDRLGRAGPFDAVVNLAGAGIGDRRWTPSRRALIAGSRRDATELLARTAGALTPTPAVMVSASAVGIYGHRGEEHLTEESGLGTGFLADVCRAWEEAAAPAADAGIRVVLLRSGVVLAADGGILPRMLAPFRLGLGGRLGRGDQYVSYITLVDEVAVILRAVVDARLAGPVNATAPNPVTNAELTRALGRVLRRPAVIAVPRPVLAGVLGREMARELLLSSQRALPARLLAVDFAFAHDDIAGALGSVLSPRRVGVGPD
jgi:uncharacterized protein (TIGR01777 family)